MLTIKEIFAEIDRLSPTEQQELSQVVLNRQINIQPKVGIDSPTFLQRLE